MIIIPKEATGGSSATPTDIKLSDIKLDAKGIKDLDGRIGYGHNHTADQVIFSKLDWTDKYILNDIITELHNENTKLQTTLTQQTKDINQLKKQIGDTYITITK